MIAVFQRWVGAPLFQQVMLGVILLSALVVGLETSTEVMRRWGGVLHTLDLLIVGAFSAEIALRLLAQGSRWWDFFRDPWNLFDFLVVALCLLPLELQFAPVLRLARVLRVLRLVTAVPGLQILVSALLKSIPSMAYVGALLGLHFYVYAVAGVFLFRAADPEHFGTLGRALLTLFQVVTMEGWADIMRHQLASGSLGPAPLVVVAFFVTFILLGTMIILNLLIGVIMNAMQEAQEERAHAEAVRQGEASVQQDAEMAAIERDLAALARRVERVRIGIRRST